MILKTMAVLMLYNYTFVSFDNDSRYLDNIKKRTSYFYNQLNYVRRSILTLNIKHNEKYCTTLHPNL